MTNSAQEGRSVRFARSVGWNISSQAAIAVLGFLLIPYLISRLGIEVYGLYILMHTIANYLLMFSFGSGASAITHVAEFKAAGDGGGLRDTVRYASWLHAAGPSLAAAVIFFGARFFVADVFQVPEALFPQAIFVLRCGAVGAIFWVLIQPAIAALQGVQRFDLMNLVVFLQGGLMPLGVAGITAAGLGIKGVALCYLALNAVIFAFAAGLTWSLLKPLLALPRGKGTTLKAFASRGLHMWLVQIALVVTYQFDKVLIAHGLSLAELSLYAVPVGLLQRFQIIPGVVSTAILPMLSELHGTKDEESLRRVYLRSVRFLLWIALPALTLLFVVMPQFLGLWVGGDFSSRSVWPGRWLVIAQIFTLLSAMCNIAAFTSSKSWYMPLWAWAQALLSVLGWKLLLPRFGLLGVALASLIGQALPAVLYLHAVHKNIMGISPRRYWAECLAAPGVSAALMLAVVFPFHAWAGTWVRLIVLAAAGLLAYGGAAWLLLDKDDREMVAKVLRRLTPGRTSASAA